MCIENYFEWWVKQKIASILIGVLAPITAKYCFNSAKEILKIAPISSLILIITAIILLTGPYYSIIIMLVHLFSKK